MWNHFPLEIGLRDGRDWSIPAGSEGASGDIEVAAGPLYLTAKAQPDGSGPIFPDGAEIDVWYFTGYHYGTDTDPYGLATPVTRSTPVPVDLTALTWTWNADISLYVSDSVLTLPSSTMIGWWYQESLGMDWEADPPVEIFGDLQWQSDGDISDHHKVVCGSMEDGSTSALALRTARASWGNAGRGRYAPGITFGWGDGSGVSQIFGKTVAVPKASLGLFCSFTGSANYYTSAAITASDEATYPVGSTTTPLMSVSGYTLTGQTATTRTWTSGEKSVVIELSSEVTDWSPYFSPESATVEITDFGHFLMATQFETETSWTLVFRTDGWYDPDAWVAAAGTITLLLYGSSGVETATVSLSKITIEEGEFDTVCYLSDAWTSGRHPLAVTGMTGTIATGWNDNAGSFTFGLNNTVNVGIASANMIKVPVVSTF